MACAILAERRLRNITWLAVFLVSVSIGEGMAARGAAGQGTCPGLLVDAEEVLQQQYGEFKQSLEKGPFYKTMVKRLGLAQTCSAREEEGAIILLYGFEGGASLTAKRVPLIEFSEQRITVSNLDQQEAVDLIRETERDFFSTDGCGIAWQDAPTKEADSTSDTYELVYRGEVCNCQGRLVYQKGALVALVFRSAC